MDKGIAYEPWLDAVFQHSETQRFFDISGGEFDPDSDPVYTTELLIKLFTEPE